jgi:acetylornithine deacetylase/succinyl-diaminopimelate desuccinylase-like protein
MIDTNRRTFLGAGALVSLGGASASAASPPPSGASIEADLLKYVGFGEKRAGGVGDTACGEWLAGELEKAGYKVEKQSFSGPVLRGHARRTDQRRAKRSGPIPSRSSSRPAPTAFPDPW